MKHQNFTQLFHKDPEEYWERFYKVMDEMKPNSGMSSPITDEYAHRSAEFELMLSENFLFAMMSTEITNRPQISLKLTSAIEDRGVVSSAGLVRFDKVWNFSEIRHSGYKRCVRFLPVLGLSGAVAVCLYDSYEAEGDSFESPGLIPEAFVIIPSQLLLGTVFILRLFSYLTKDWTSEQVFSGEASAPSLVVVH